MARKDDPDTDRFRQRRESSPSLLLIPTEPIHVSPAVLPAQDQVAGDEFPRGLVVENHRLLRVARRGDHLPATEADPGTGQAVPFEILDPVRIGHALKIPEERQGHTGRTVESQIGPFPDAECAADQCGQETGDPVPHGGERPTRLQVGLHEGMEQDRRLRGAFLQQRFSSHDSDDVTIAIPATA